MTGEKPPRYTAEQIMCGLRDVWPRIVCNRTAFEPDTRIDEYMKQIGLWDEIDFADVAAVLESYFGFTCSAEEWKSYMGAKPYVRSEAEWDEKIAPRFTFGSLAEFIADRTVAVPFEPVMVLGKRCEAAGTFRLIEAVTRDVVEGSKPFAPSTQIRDRLRGRRLRRVWTRLRWICYGRLPPLEPRWRARAAARCGLILGIISVIGLASVLACIHASAKIVGWHESMSLVLRMAAPLMAPVIGGLLVSYLAHRLSNPLPSGIHTFRDLAKAVVAARAEPQHG